MMALLAASGLMTALPSQAAAESGSYYQNRQYGGCLRAIGAGANAAVNEGCTLTDGELSDRWTTIPRGTSPSGHSLIQLQNKRYGTCLDSNATDTGAAWIRGCNQGEYQMWEVFVTTVGSAKKFTFKSWGAWQLQGRHRCLTTTAEWAQEKLAECDQTKFSQQWQ